MAETEMVERILQLHERSLKAHARTFQFGAGTKKQTDAFKAFDKQERLFEQEIRRLLPAPPSKD